MSWNVDILYASIACTVGKLHEYAATLLNRFPHADILLYTGNNFLGQLKIH